MMMYLVSIYALTTTVVRANDVHVPQLPQSLLKPYPMTHDLDRPERAIFDSQLEVEEEEENDVVSMVRDEKQNLRRRQTAPIYGSGLGLATPNPTPNLPPIQGIGCGENSYLLSRNPTANWGAFMTYNCQCFPGFMCREAAPGRQHLPCEIIANTLPEVSNTTYTCFGTSPEACFSDAFSCVPIPSSAPSSTTTSAPSAVPTPAPSNAPTQECARNCGQVENGGGTCLSDNSSYCTSCNDGNLLTTDLGPRVESHIKGNCISRVTCDRRLISGGRFDGERCTPCLDTRCFKCQIRHEAGDPSPSEICFRCRDGYYLQGDRCIQQCPSDKTSSGANLFGRRCMDPFTCRSNRVLNYTDSRGCKCPRLDNSAIDQDCHTCNFNAGEFGQQCTKCRNGKYLYNDTCFENCSAFPGTVQYRHGNYGSRCRQPFTCLNGLDENGEVCKCKFVQANCRSCHFGLFGNICLDS